MSIKLRWLLKIDVHWPLDYGNRRQIGTLIGFLSLQVRVQINNVFPVAMIKTITTTTMVFRSLTQLCPMWSKQPPTQYVKTRHMHSNNNRFIIFIFTYSLS